MDPLSCLWKGLEDIRKAPSAKAVEIPMKQNHNLS